MEEASEIKRGDGISEPALEIDDLDLARLKQMRPSDWSSLQAIAILDEAYKLKKANNPEAIPLLKKITEGNKLDKTAAILLSEIYSKGLCGEPINKAEAENWRKRGV